MHKNRFSIAQVTPYAWEEPREANRFIARLSRELSSRGHRVVIVAPSNSRKLVRESRALIKQAADNREALFDGGLARVLGVGQTLPLTSARMGGSVALPIDVAATLEDLFDLDAFDFVHVHEPFAPSAASAALRASRALNVGTFHTPTERVLSTQVARKRVERLFGRLDARTTSSQATRDLVRTFFPGEYETIRTGADAIDRAPDTSANKVVELVYVAGAEERAALRLVLRALRKLPDNANWHATILLSGATSGQAPPAISRRLREHVTFNTSRKTKEKDLLAKADVVIAASSGAAPSTGYLTRAIASGAAPVAANLPVYQETLDYGEIGLQFDVGIPDALTEQLQRLIEDRNLLKRTQQYSINHAPSVSWSRVADEFERVYNHVAELRHGTKGNAALRKKLSSRPKIAVDLHMHTDHSHDCATPVELLLETAREQGLGAIAITDHNEVSGALAAAEIAADYGVKVIVAEEVKTKDQGEVIGLFIKEKIPRDMTLEETIAEIKRQGGLVYVPHPFDRMHSVPDYENLLKVIGDIDAIEIFNPRVAFTAFNEEAERFAAKYRIVAGAGSDSHVIQGLGSVKINMHDFDGPAEFLESLRDADIVRRKSSLLYVQALKFIQTKTPVGPPRKTKNGSNGLARSAAAAGSPAGKDSAARRRAARKS